MKIITRILIIFLSLSLFQSVYAQNLLTERIRKLSGRKKSIYFAKGIFHNGHIKTKSTLKGIRHSYVSARGYERIVFDFTSKNIPRIYGYISRDEKKIYMDLFDTSLPKIVNAFGNSKYVKAVNFFPIDKDLVSVEIKLREKVGADIFFLKNHGRLVIDIKK